MCQPQVDVSEADFATISRDNWKRKKPGSSDSWIWVRDWARAQRQWSALGALNAVCSLKVPVCLFQLLLPAPGTSFLLLPSTFLLMWAQLSAFSQVLPSPHWAAPLSHSVFSVCVYRGGVLFNPPCPIPPPPCEICVLLCLYWPEWILIFLSQVLKKNTESTLQLKNVFNLINTFVLLLLHYVNCDLYQLSPVASIVPLYPIILHFNVPPACLIRA